EYQQGLWPREPAKQLEPRFAWHRRAILDEGEHIAAAARIGGEAAHVLDRARGRYHREGAVLAFGPLGEVRGKRVIVSSGRACQNRRVQVTVIASDAEGCSHGREQCSDDDEEHGASNHLAAPEGMHTRDRIGRLHRRRRRSLLIKHEAAEWRAGLLPCCRSYQNTAAERTYARLARLQQRSGQYARSSRCLTVQVGLRRCA